MVRTIGTLAVSPSISNAWPGIEGCLTVEAEDDGDEGGDLSL